ncbi:MAG: hypothetical protein NTW86_24740 [Candidatus Sumerlaeota bacterium]|nr:hypothetical protein [Candidatus Sumerlaeota bacterium]
MATFLFWNLHGRRLARKVSNLASLCRADVVMLAECQIGAVEILDHLNKSVTEFHYAASIGCDKIKVFTRFPDTYARPVFEEDRLTIRHVRLPGLKEILLAVVHFPSKRNWSDASQSAECVRLADTIRKAEKEVGHQRTALVGDLNMNPFEAGMLSAIGLHGVMCKRIAQKRSREVQGREYPYFYNPMWSLMGDESPGPPGTYYYASSEQNVVFWNTFDQVLLRPELIARFDFKSLKVLVGDGTEDLLKTDGTPDTKIGSDHLPLVFTLSL